MDRIRSEAEVSGLLAFIIRYLAAGPVMVPTTRWHHVSKWVEIAPWCLTLQWAARTRPVKPIYLSRVS